MTEEWIDISDPRRPNRDEVVQVKTVWNDGVSNIKFQGEVSTTWPEKGRYEGFGVLKDNAVKCWRHVSPGRSMTGVCEHVKGKRSGDPQGFVCYKCGAPHEVNLHWPPAKRGGDAEDKLGMAAKALDDLQAEIQRHHNQRERVRRGR